MLVLLYGAYISKRLVTISFITRSYDETFIQIISWEVVQRTSSPRQQLSDDDFPSPAGMREPVQVLNFTVKSVSKVHGQLKKCFELQSLKSFSQKIYFQVLGWEGLMGYMFFLSTVFSMTISAILVVLMGHIIGRRNKSNLFLFAFTFLIRNIFNK